MGGIAHNHPSCVAEHLGEHVAVRNMFRIYELVDGNIKIFRLHKHVGVTDDDEVEMRQILVSNDRSCPCWSAIEICRGLAALGRAGGLPGCEWGEVVQVQRENVRILEAIIIRTYLQRVVQNKFVPVHKTIRFPDVQKRGVGCPDAWGEVSDGKNESGSRGCDGVLR